MTLGNRILADERRPLLKKLLENKKTVITIEVHNGISAVVGNNNYIKSPSGEKIGFDALWVSSLTETAAKGFPDAEITGFDSRLITINEVAEVSNKPIIVDGDTGGDFNHFEYMVKRLERVGVSAVIIEDKKFPKRNSLSGEARQDLEDPRGFADKIRRGKKVTLSKDFMIIARIESLIAGTGQEDAIKRAEHYLKADADGIMIHSKSKSPEDILIFARNYEKLCKKLGFRKPLVCVPTTYNTINNEELHKNGFDIIIYANHLLRASYKAMCDVADTILTNQRSFEADAFCAPVRKIFDVVGFSELRKKDEEEFGKYRLNAIIPAAGVQPNLPDKPVCMLEIDGKPILQRQVETLRNLNINNISVIRGYKKEAINLPDLKYYDIEIDLNKQTRHVGLPHSLIAAEESMNKGFIMIFSDIVFDERVIKKLLETEGDIVIVGDNSYEYYEHEVYKKLSLIITKSKSSGLRKLKIGSEDVVMVGKEIKKEAAHYEFVGIVKFSKEGADNFKRVYYDCKQNHKGRFHEAESFEKASITDMLQEMIDRGFKVSLCETNKGWMEIHNELYYKKACEELA